jgi:WhiB family transcriptional regulator, redox-sensing transcriptional regulator
VLHQRVQQTSATLSGSDNWMREPRFYEDPACATVGGDFWFPEKSDGSSNSTEMLLAISICKKCTHQVECAEWGIENERFGIWGGVTENQRRNIRREKDIKLRGEDVA